MSAGHGGKRAGAGRKSREVPREAFTLRIEPGQAEKFRALCKANGRSYAEQFAAWIERAKL